MGRKSLELLAEDISTLHRLRLFGETPQDTLFIPPRLRYLDCAKTIPDGEIDWKKIAVSKEFNTITTRITENDSQFVVLFGDMGAGKSCLMRVLASQAAQQYLVNKKRPVVFVRWREIYEKSNLLEAIAEHIQTAHGLPTDDFSRQEKITFFIDGFDEMSSHQNEVVWRLFLKLAELVKRGHSVVVAMRSSILTHSIQETWRTNKAYVVRVLPFGKKEVDGWAVLWQKQTTDVSVTGERLRELANEDVTANPLLLFMLARYIHPSAEGKKISRAEVFRTFVNETIPRKNEARNEDDVHSAEMKKHYRLLLQEMAYLASWPKANGKCAENDIGTILKKNREKLQIKEPRTAFVLHFFNPGNVQNGEFEFQPEGFRHYLLAEWCVRALLEVHQDPMAAKTLPLRRKREAAMQALAQFPLREVERELLNDIATELGTLVRESADTELVERLRSFGFNLAPAKARELVERLRRGLWRHAVTPPAHPWKAENVGIPEGQEIPECLDGVRLLVNYWDQTLLACFGLARGISDETPVPSPEEQTVELGRFFHLCSSLRGTSPGTGLNLSRMPLSNVDLSQTQGIETDFTYADLTRAKLYLCNFSYANFSFANLQYANLYDSNLKGTMLCSANLTGVLTGFTNLTDADLAGADLTDANLTDANLTDADLTGADLTGADFAYADLTRANLHNAKVDRVRWKGAILPKGFTPPE